MEKGCSPKCPLPPILRPLLGFVFFLVDVVLDVLNIVSLYQKGEYVYVGLLIAVLLASSVLAQVYSWMWYSDCKETLESRVEKSARRHGLIGLLHIFQLGMFLRFVGVVEISISNPKQNNKEGRAGSLSPDMSMLRLIEAFTESAPQLVILICVTIQEQELQLFQGLKIAGSFGAIALCLLSYHRNMRKFVPEDQKMGWSSSAVFFLWNLLLITPRVLAVALFASILPCYIAAHFLSWWLLLFLWAWRQKTDFMDTEGGEWLYRATVGLIWYFSWFNVSSRKTKVRSNIYHVCMGADMGLILGLWFWKRSVESARLSPLPVNPYILIGGLPALYITGFLLKLLYYRKFHLILPRLISSVRDVSQIESEVQEEEFGTIMPEPDTEPQRPFTGFHKRRRNMAVNFYH
ncbi:hypothetical protein AOLI_G00301570 [Acnodon oligacanthus]